MSWARCLLGHRWASNGIQRVCRRCGRREVLEVDAMFNERHWMTVDSE